MRGDERRSLGPGDYFGEIALIDDGARSATITAVSDLRCYGLTSWEFRPLVESNASMAWKLLETMAQAAARGPATLSRPSSPTPGWSRSAGAATSRPGARWSTLLALRLRDLPSRPSGCRARRRGRLPGGLRPRLRAARDPARRRAVRPWIGQLTRRLCIDRLRAGSRETVRTRTTCRRPPRTTSSRSSKRPSTSTTRWPTLPENCREILDRFFARDESYRTIGEALELPAGTIASRISRCLEKLRDVFEGRNQAPARPVSR